MGLQTSVSNCTVYYQGRVHCYLTSSTWRHSCHERTTGNEGANLQGHLCWTLCLPQSIWRQHRSPRTCKASKAMSKDQAHKCLLASFLQTRAKGAYQDLPHQHQRPDCWHTHKSTGTKWLPASLSPYVRCVTSLSHQSEGVLCNRKYFGNYLGMLHISRDLVMRKVTLVMRKVNKHFGTYLGYLPTIPCHHNVTHSS